MRNGVSDWPVEKQLEALAEAGFTGPMYEDTLSRNQMRGREAKHLIKRAVLLRPTARRAPGMIKVASIRVFALSLVDLMDALVQAAARQETIIALDTGLEIGPDAGAAQFAAATLAWDKGRRNAQTLDGRAKGNQAAAEAARRRSDTALAIARPLWSLPSEEMSAATIAERAGLSVTALYRLLGRRTPMQRRAKLKKGTPSARQPDHDPHQTDPTAKKADRP